MGVATRDNASAAPRQPLPCVQQCTRCAMDTTEPGIVFDGAGVCNHCTRAASLLADRLPMYGLLPRQIGM